MEKIGSQLKLSCNLPYQPDVLLAFELYSCQVWQATMSGRIQEKSTVLHA